MWKSIIFVLPQEVVILCVVLLGRNLKKKNLSYNMFPQDIVNKILEYDGRIKYRKGKYINQLSISHDKYSKIVKLINKKSLYSLYKFPFYLHILLKIENGKHI